MSKTVSKVLVMLAGFLVIGLFFSGCDNLLADDEDNEDDGTLAASVSGVTETCGVDQNVVFVAFVFDAGADIEQDGAVLAAVGAEVTDGSSSGTAFVWGDDARPTWTGKGGNSYDVYPTIYCVLDNDAEPPQKADPDDGDTVKDFYEVNADLVYESANWDQPVTYKQDGNKSISTAFGDYEATGS